MQYRFEIAKRNYEIFSSGQVIKSLSHLPAFPVRLAGEILMRAGEYLEKDGRQGPYCVYDPCCGGGYLLTCLGFLKRQYIRELIGSDIDEKVLEIAGKNLGLLGTEGLEARKAELQSLYDAYQKESHGQSLQAVEALRKLIEEPWPVAPLLFHGDAFNPARLQEQLGQRQIDIVFADIPYANQSQWSGAGTAPIEQLLESLRHVIQSHTIVVIVSAKRDSGRHAAFTQLKMLRAGKRKIVFYSSLKTDE